MANALAQETSPYLRQHASNPVDWLPWGQEALTRAEREDRPLLVSIGYSACHWCHVMERESFEDVSVARLMNESFVCVKVDREERPDIDAIYIDAVQQMTGSGGWPLNVFLTPEQLPFFGGTYFPPRRTSGMPSWTEVITAVATAWRERRPEIQDTARQMRQRLAGAAALKPSAHPLHADTLSTALSTLRRSFDTVHGGFGGAPKFPQTPVMELLLSEAALSGSEAASRMALDTLRAIAQGGIHDLVGGGFHRYAVDATWTVPHFEKMLYDNALLARACLRAFVHSRERELLDASLNALDWMLREMQGPEGAFYSALDADSEGVEGAFYVWTIAQLRDALGEHADAAIAWTGATERGNFLDVHHPQPGLNVLRSGGERPDLATQRRIRELLLASRERRARPGLDDKRLTAWNALAISALAETGAHLQAEALEGIDPGLPSRLLDAAERCADFVMQHMRTPDGGLLRSYSGGRASITAYLEDHAFLLEALLTLYEATFEERHFQAALQLADQMIDRFADPLDGGFYSTALDAEPLVARRKDMQDAPIPAGSSSAALGLLRLAALTGQRRYEEHAVGTLRLLHEAAGNHPEAFGHLLQAVRLALAPMKEVAIVGPPGEARDALLKVVRQRLRPNIVLALASSESETPAVPLLAHRRALGGRPTAYVCERFSCRQPVTDPRALRELLDGR